MARIPLLHDETVFNQEVDAIARIQVRTAIDDRDRDLASEGDLGMTEFRGKTGLIRGLKQPRTKSTMHLDRRADHPVAQCIKRWVAWQAAPSFVSFVPWW